VVPLQIKCYRDALGLCKTSYVHLMILICCLTLKRPDYRSLADGKFTTAKVLVPKCLDSCSLITIRKFFQKAWRYMDAYQYVLLFSCACICYRLDNTISRKGLNVRQAAFANKKYKSHQRVGLPNDILDSINTKDTSKRQ
jgi:hypothetical protein